MGFESLPGSLIRRIVAIALIAEAALVFAAAWWLLLWIFVPVAFLAALALLVAAPVAAWVVWRGRLSEDPARAVAQVLAGLVVALGQAGLAIVAVVGVSAALADANRCEERFDFAEWRASDDRLDQAETLAECGMLEGATRADVRRLLGRRDGGGTRRWAYFAGAINDTMGPGDAAYLVVRFGRDGRVTRVVPPE